MILLLSWLFSQCFASVLGPAAGTTQRRLNVRFRLGGATVRCVRRLQEIAFQCCGYGAHIGDATVGCAVGLAREDRLTAEPETGGSRLSERPVAPVCGSRHDLG